MSLSVLNCAEPPATARDGSPTPDLLAQVFDELDQGVLVLTPHGHLRHANRYGLALLRTGQALQLRHGVVTTRCASLSAPWHSAWQQAQLGRRSLVRLTGEQAGEPPCMVALVPLLHEGQVQAVVLRLPRTHAVEPLTLTFFARCHQLTAAESTVLQALCEGLRPTQIAQRQGVAVSTVRTHIGRLRDKTGQPSVRRLLQTLALLPGITPVLQDTPARTTDTPCHVIPAVQPCPTR